MNFNKVLTENYKRYKINYSGSRPEYDINDKNPYILSLDGDYSYDGNGASILGVNLNYYDGDKKELIKKINKNDNDAGFRGFDFKMKFKKDKELKVAEKKRRYQNFIKEFPYLGKFIRRYKVIAIDSKKRAIRK